MQALENEAIVRGFSAEDADYAGIFVFRESLGDFVVDFAKIFLLVLWESKKEIQNLSYTIKFHGIFLLTFPAASQARFPFGLLDSDRCSSRLT